MIRNRPQLSTAGPLASHPLHVALLVGPDAIDVYGAGLRHLCVGLFDEGLQVSLLADAELALSEQALGPVRIYPIPRRSVLARAEALRRVAEKLDDDECHLLHALTEATLGWLPILSRELEVNSLATVTHVADLPRDTAGWTEPAAAGSTGGLSLVERDTGLGGWPGFTYHWRAQRARRAMPLVSRWLALTPRVARSHRRILGGEPQTVELGIFAAESSAAFSADTREVGILTVCPFEKRCGVDRLLDALGQMSDGKATFQAFLSGTGSDEHALRGQCAKLGLTSRVTFAPLLMDWRPFIGSLDVYVQPAPLRQIRSDLLEAMASGMVCISCRDSAEDWVQEGVTGLLVPPNDTAALGAALQRLLGDRPFARQLAENARCWVRERCGPTRMISALAEQYRSVIRTPGAAGKA